MYARLNLNTRTRTHTDTFLVILHKLEELNNLVHPCSFGDGSQNSILDFNYMRSMALEVSAIVQIQLEIVLSQRVVNFNLSADLALKIIRIISIYVRRVMF